MIIKKYGDIIAGVVFLALAGLYYQGTFMVLKFKMSRYGAEFVPRIYAAILAAVALGLIARGVAGLLRAPAEADAGKATDRRAMAKVVLSLLLIAVYIYLLQPAGFLVATAFYLAAQTLVTAPPGKIRPLSILLFAVLVSCSVSYLFRHVFHLALPEGILSF